MFSFWAEQLEEWDGAQEEDVDAVVHALVDWVEVAEVEEDESDGEVTAPYVVEYGTEAILDNFRYKGEVRTNSFGSQFVPVVKNEGSNEEAVESWVEPMPNSRHHKRDQGGERIIAWLASVVSKEAQVHIVLEPLVN